LSIHYALKLVYSQLWAEDMSDAGTNAGVIVALVIIFFLIVIIISKGFWVVNHSQVMIIERFGQYHRTLTPGAHWIWPFIDQPRRIDWRYIEMGWGDKYPKVKHIVTEYIDLREHVLDFPRRDVITKDTVQISIDALVYFRITDPRAAVYRVQNLPDAIEMLTQSTLRNIIAGLTLDETFSSREYVNDKLLHEIERDATRWGVQVTRLAIEDIRPPMDIRQAMESQIQEERERRSTVIRADGERERNIIRSRGNAAKVVLSAEGRKLGDIARAKGEAIAKIKIAEAEAASFAMLQEALGGEYRAADYMAALQYVDNLPNAVGNSEVILIPNSSLNALGDINAQAMGTVAAK